MFETWKLKAYDSLELVRSTAIQKDAPKHFHDGYSIGIATKGLQTIQLEHGDYLIEPGTLMFLNEREVHAHRQVEYSPWSHRMLYISPDYINWLQEKGMIHHPGNLSFQTPLAGDQNMYTRFFRLHDLITSGYAVESNAAFDETISSIFNTFAAAHPADFDHRSALVGEIQYYLDQHHQNKLQLEDLALRFKIDKYQLIRNFKRRTGVTPNEYLNIIRVEAAKKFLLDGRSLVTAALEAGYYDQSHFTHNFLKYTCFTPGQFQRSCIA